MTQTLNASLPGGRRPARPGISWISALTLTIILLFAIPAYAAQAPERVVTIGGAVTEIVYELGAQDTLAGNDTTSYYPPAANALPKVGYHRALSAEGILSLTPDLVILTEDAGPPPVLRQLESAGIALLEVKAGRSVADVVDNIRTIAQALDREAAGEALIAEMAADLAALRASLPTDAAKPRVMFIHQHVGGTPSAAGSNTAADSIIALSGGKNVVTEYEGYKPLTPEAAIAFAPELIVVTVPNPQDTPEEHELLKSPVLQQTPAGKNGNVIAVDALLMLGFGPRTVEAAQRLAEAYDTL